MTDDFMVEYYIPKNGCIRENKAVAALGVPSALSDLSVQESLHMILGKLTGVANMLGLKGVYVSHTVSYPSNDDRFSEVIQFFGEDYFEKGQLNSVPFEA